jgi:hypothetical protein
MEDLNCKKCRAKLFIEHAVPHEKYFEAIFTCQQLSKMKPWTWKHSRERWFSLDGSKWTSGVVIPGEEITTSVYVHNGPPILMVDGDTLTVNLKK